MNVIAFSVYGIKRRYLQGAVENLLLAPEIYPGWKIWVYCENSIDPSLLAKRGAKVFRMPRSLNHSGMFWRFLAAYDPEVERAIFRDTDSRLNPREAAAVAEWIESGEDAHAMHDHPHHAGFPLFGGMWGVKGGVLDDGSHRRLRWEIKRTQKRVADMQFLRRRIYPQVEESVLHHSSVEVRWASSPFPEHAPWEGFVGEQHSEHGPVRPVMDPLPGPGTHRPLPGRHDERRPTEARDTEPR